MLRPIISAEVQSVTGDWEPLNMLVDTGADCTVFSEDIFRAIGVKPGATKQQLAGVGGQSASVSVTTKLRFVRDDGVFIHIGAQFAAVTDPAALDISVPGRDITNMFALVVDRPQDVVCMLGQRHTYTIVAD